MRSFRGYVELNISGTLLGSLDPGFRRDDGMANFEGVFR
jgi:hypothetical protein